MCNIINMKIGPFSLKWRIMIFYFMLGFMPLLTISYISYYIASDSIGQMTGRQMNQLMDRISQQTGSSFQKARDDMFQLSQNPIIQLSFLQFSYGQRMETLRERMAVYRTNSGTLDMIALFTPDGEPVLSSPAETDDFRHILDSEEIKEAFKTNFSIKQHLTGEKNRSSFLKECTTTRMRQPRWVYLSL